jgi:hypothetical protein
MLAVVASENFTVSLIVTVSPVPKVPPQVRTALNGTIDLFAGGVKATAEPYAPPVPGVGFAVLTQWTPKYAVSPLLTSLFSWNNLTSHSKKEGGIGVKKGLGFRLQ